MICRIPTGRLAAAAALAAALLAGGCGNLPVEGTYPERVDRETYDPTGSARANERDTVFGPGGLTLGGSKRDEGEAGGGIGVNSYLWRASLDTVSFLPLASADAFGGVIITDWYSPANAPDERFKVTIYILDRRLRADGLKVAVFKQARQDGGWVDAPVSSNTTIDLENAILTRARQLRINSASG